MKRFEEHCQKPFEPSKIVRRWSKCRSIEEFVSLQEKIKLQAAIGVVPLTSAQRPRRKVVQTKE